MADSTISNLPASTGVDPTNDVLPIVHTSTTQKVSPQDIVDAAFPQVPFTPTGSISATTVNAAIVELDTKKADAATTTAALATKAPLSSLPTAMDTATAQAGTSTTPQTVSASVLKTSIGNFAGLANSVALIPNDSSTLISNQNAQLLQNAINSGGLIAIRTPGVYYIGDSLEADLYVSVFLKNNIEIYLAQGVYLTQNTQDKSLFANSNYQSPQVPINIAGVTITYPTTGVNVGSTVVTIPTTGSVAHGLLSGDPVYIKNDTSLQINGVFTVDTVPNAYTITIVMNGFSAIRPLNLPTGSPVMHKCNVNINFKGNGVIDYNNKNTTGTLPLYPSTGYGAYNGLGNGNTQHGTILNKVGYCEFSLATKNCQKYGVYFCNAVGITAVLGYTSTKSSPIQWNGPCTDVTVRDGYGSNGDDPIPFIGTNAGYSSYDLLDVGNGTAVKGSDGPFRGISIYNSRPKAGKTRNIIIATGNGADATNLYIDNISNSNLTSNFVGALVIELPTGHTSSIKGLVIGNIEYCPSPSLNTTGPFPIPSPIIVLANNGTGSNDIQFTINSIVIKGENANGYGGVRNSVVALGSQARGVKGVVNSVVCDASPLNQDVKIFDLQSSGKVELSIGSMVINQIATGNWVYGVSCNNAIASNISVNSIIMTGANCCPFFENIVDGNVINCNSVIVNSTASGMIHNSSKASTFNYGTVTYNGANSAGTFYYGDSTVNRTVNLLVNQYYANCDYHLRTLTTLATAVCTINLSIGMGSNAHASAVFYTNNGYPATPAANLNKIVLLGPINGKRMDLNGTNDIHATVANHASGGYFYNNAAGYGTGVGVYMKGSTTFTKIAA